MNKTRAKSLNAKKTTIKSRIEAQRRRGALLGRVIILVAIVAAMVGGGYLLQPRSQGETSPETGRNLGTTAPDFSLIDLDGNSFKLSDFRGKVVVIDFMATWCGQCRLEMPHYGTIWERYGNKITLMSIDIDPGESEETLRTFAQEFPYATWIWAKDTANLGQIYEVVAIPKTVIIDQEGYIRFEHTGVTSASTFMIEIEELLR